MYVFFQHEGKTSFLHHNDKKENKNMKHFSSADANRMFFEKLNDSTTTNNVDLESLLKQSSTTRRALKRKKKADKRKANSALSALSSSTISVNNSSYSGVTESGQLNGTITPLTNNQARTFSEYKSGKHLLLHGYAGTGKTFISMFLALEEILKTRGHVYEKIVVVRSVVPSRDIGFLPGSTEEKISAYEEPYIDICNSLYRTRSGNGYNRLKELELFEFTTTSFLRGVTFSNAIVIVDEMQNMTFQELDTIMTRIGENCRIIFCGDFRQTDLEKKSDKSGIHKFMKIIEKLKNFSYVEFGKEDIVRSALVKDYIIARTESEERGDFTTTTNTRVIKNKRIKVGETVSTIKSADSAATIISTG